MHTLIVFDSEFGNAQKIAEAIATQFNAEGPIDLLKAGNDDIPESMDLLIVGGPTQVHGVTRTLRKYLYALPAAALDGIPAAAFDTRIHDWKAFTGGASSGIAKQLKKRGAQLVVPPESFLVADTEGPLVEGELARAQTWAQTVLAAMPTKTPATAIA